MCLLPEQDAQLVNKWCLSTKLLQYTKENNERVCKLEPLALLQDLVKLDIDI